MAHGLADKRFHCYEEAKKWIDSWRCRFFDAEFIYCQKDEREVSSDGQYFD